MSGLDHNESMPEGPAVQTLVETLRAVAAVGGGSTPRRDRAATLREATFAAVDELKGAGRSAIDVLFVIEAVVERAGVVASDDTLDALTALIVQRYFNRERQQPPGT
jgi:hypothetical protein